MFTQHNLDAIDNIAVGTVRRCQHPFWVDQGAATVLPIIVVTGGRKYQCCLPGPGARHCFGAADNLGLINLGWVVLRKGSRRL